MDLYSVRKKLSDGVILQHISLRVTYYSRVSTDDIKQINSLKNQMSYFYEMIKQNENWIYVDGYIDEGITGTSDVKRDDFMRMISDAKEGKFDLIITKEISRFSRNTLDSIRYTRELLGYGVAVLFVNDNINTILPDSELRLTIMASMAQDEIRRLSERVKFGMNRAIIDGHILGNDRLFGYRKNKESGNLEIDVRESEIIRKIYDMYVISDLSLSMIVRYLNSCNIKTSMNKNFSVATLSRMLRNPKYKGYYCGRKSEIVDYMSKKVKYFDEKDWVMYEDKIKVPPIISEEMWERAFNKLEKRSRKFGKGLDSKGLYKNKYSLSAKIYCDKHKDIFYRRKMSKNSSEIVWWCSHYLNYGKNACNISSIRQSELYYIFDDILSSLSIDLENVMNMLLKLYLDNINNTSNDVKMKRYREIFNKIKRSKDKLLGLNINGYISDSEFRGKNDRYNEELLEIEEKINMLKSEVLGKNIDKNGVLLKSKLENKLEKDNIRDFLINLLINKIIVSSNNKEVDVELKIYFNFSLEFIKNETDSNLFFYNDLNYFYKNNYQFCRNRKISNIKYMVECYCFEKL